MNIARKKKAGRLTGSRPVHTQMLDWAFTVSVS